MVDIKVGNIPAVSEQVLDNLPFSSVNEQSLPDLIEDNNCNFKEGDTNELIRDVKKDNLVSKPNQNDLKILDQKQGLHA